MLAAVRKDMTLTMAYDCLFGVAGRIVVLRQPNFVAFLLSLLGLGGFEFGIRVWEAVRFRRKTIEAVAIAEGWDAEKEIDPGNPPDRVEEVVEVVHVGPLEDGNLPVPNVSQFVGAVTDGTTKCDRPSVKINVPEDARNKPDDILVEPHRNTSISVPHVSHLHDLEAISDDSLAQVEKPKVLLSYPNPPVAQDSSKLPANVTTVSLLAKSWGAHRLAQFA
ncbi:hypothetical protein HK104_002793, partial [Borealophlyctis nickersoniae]